MADLRRPEPVFGAIAPAGRRSDEIAGLLDLRIPIREEADVAVARQRARELARREGLRESAVEALATAISEIARNILVHAGAGEIRLGVMRDRGRSKVVVMARDDGPGIADVDLAMRDGYSSAKGLGLGLPSARRLVDEFELIASPGQGTTVIMKKWSP
jgi:serine/threonine-protein kinase RsbT